MEAVVRARNLRRSYEEGGRVHEVLRGVDFEVATGELVAVVGRSGCGKSTLLNILGGIDAPSSGQVSVAGVDLGKLTEHGRTLFRREHVGYVFQFFNLIPTLTVLENVLLRPQLMAKIDRDSNERAKALLTSVGLGDRGSSYPENLSGGERQRVAIASALSHDPPVILADEPTGNLDGASATEVLDLLVSLVRERGKTLVVVTHGKDVMARADRVLTLREGQMLEAQVS